VQLSYWFFLNKRKHSSIKCCTNGTTHAFSGAGPRTSVPIRCCTWHCQSHTLDATPQMTRHSGRVLGSSSMRRVAPSDRGLQRVLHFT